MLLLEPPILKCEASAIEVQIRSAFLEEFDSNKNSVAYVSDSKEGLFNPLCAGKNSDLIPYAQVRTVT